MVHRSRIQLQGKPGNNFGGKTAAQLNFVYEQSPALTRNIYVILSSGWRNNLYLLLKQICISNEIYSIPLVHRKMENLHIMFWLFKDISWCMIWRPLGMMMIASTLLISIIIAARTRRYMSEVCHNVAICFWITANSYWMISEFLHFDTNPLLGEYTYKHLAIIPFVADMLILAFYYLWWRPRHAHIAENVK